MAVVRVIENEDSRSGEDSIERDGSGPIRVSRGFTRSFIVETDDVEDGWEIIKGSLPTLGDYYTSGNDTDLTSVCVGRSGQQRGKAKRFWDCEVEYSNDEAESPAGENEPPSEIERELRQTVRWSTSSVQRPVFTDIEGAALLNAAGDPFDPPYVQDFLILVASISRFEQTDGGDINALVDYFNSVNEDEFTLDGKTVFRHEALFGNYDSVDAIKGGSRVKQVSYTLHIWPISLGDKVNAGSEDFSWWDAFLLEHGPNYIEAGTKKPVVDSTTGFRYSQNLDKETGAKLALTAAPQFTHFKTRQRVSFSALGFQ